MEQNVKGTIIGSTHDGTDSEREPFAGPSSYRQVGYGSDEDAEPLANSNNGRALDRFSWGTGTWKSHRSNKSDKH